MLKENFIKISAHNPWSINLATQPLHKTPELMSLISTWFSIDERGTPWSTCVRRNHHINAVGILALERDIKRLHPKECKANTEALTTDSETARISKTPHEITDLLILHLCLRQEEEGGSVR
jgi:hypothetical protein